MNPYMKSQIDALGNGAQELEIYLANRPELVSGLKSLRESIYAPWIDYSQNEALPRDPESILKIATALSAAAEALPPDIAQRARPVLVRIEQAIAADIRAQIAAKLEGIYVIVDPEATRGRPVTDVARQALEGGVKVVQLRDKLNDKGDILKSAIELKSLCDEYDALFVMNDHADLARAAEAHVLHVGQTDLPVRAARECLAPTQLIGNSNNGLPEAAESAARRVDYLAVGAIYATVTMGKSGRTALGPEEITRVKEAVSEPVVAIGGINKTNIAEVVKAGADSVCVVSAITFANDPESATRELVQLYKNAKG